MKKIFLSVLAIAALASCSKFETTYEQENEIGFAPASKNITKAAMTGVLSSNDDMGIWAYWNGVSGIVEENAIYNNYTNPYLVNADFTLRTNNQWGGKNQAYPWPTNGALVFAGYNKPKDGTPAVSASYDGLTSNTLTFTDFEQPTDLSQTFDLCWFGKTASSYNNRATNVAVSVTMSHALTWITIKVKGDGTTAPENGNKWRITKATLLNVNTKGTGTCTVGDNGPSATWNSSTSSNIIIKNSPQYLSTTASAYESTTNGIVIIPQTPVQLEVEYEYPVSGSTYVQGKSTIDLTLNHPEANKTYKDENGVAINEGITTWLSGKHYTYTLVFKANEILVAPNYGEWATEDKTVTVE